MKKKKLFLCTIFLVALMLLGSLTFTAGAAEVSAANNTVGTVQLRAVNRISSTKVRLTWNKVPQASGYRVYRKTGNSGWKALKNGSAAAWACTDTTVKPGTKYTYTVRAYKRVNGKVIWGGYNKNGLSVSIPGKVVEMKNYFQQGVSRSEMQRLISDIGGMKKTNNSKKTPP